MKSERIGPLSWLSPRLAPFQSGEILRRIKVPLVLGPSCGRAESQLEGRVARTAVQESENLSHNKCGCPRADKRHRDGLPREVITSTIVEAQREVRRVLIRDLRPVQVVFIAFALTDIRPKLLACPRIWQRVDGDRVKILRRSAKTAFDDAKKISGCKMPSRSIGVEAAQRKSRLIVTAPKVLVEEPLDEPRPESAALKPGRAGARLVLANIIAGEDELIVRFPSRLLFRHQCHIFKFFRRNVLDFDGRALYSYFDASK